MKCSLPGRWLLGGEERLRVSAAVTIAKVIQSSIRPTFVRYIFQAFKEKNCVRPFYRADAKRKLKNRCTSEVRHT